MDRESQRAKHSIIEAERSPQPGIVAFTGTSSAVDIMVLRSEIADQVRPAVRTTVISYLRRQKLRYPYPHAAINASQRR